MILHLLFVRVERVLLSPSCLGPDRAIVYKGLTVAFLLFASLPFCTLRRGRVSFPVCCFFVLCVAPARFGLQLDSTCVVCLGRHCWLYITMFVCSSLHGRRG